MGGGTGLPQCLLPLPFFLSSPDATSSRSGALAPCPDRVLGRLAPVGLITLGPASGPGGGDLPFTSDQGEAGELQRGQKRSSLGPGQAAKAFRSETAFI